MSSPGLIASLRQRLSNKAQETGEVFDFVLSRYANERLLYRLGESEFKEQFVLKGALLFYLWNSAMHRPTRDVDFMGFGPSDTETLTNTFRTIATIAAPDDGLVFQTDSISAEPIREEALYDGIRIKFLATLGNIRIPLQIDVGFGDAITPASEFSVFPSLLPESPKARIRAYPVYTVLAEKLEAMVNLGDRNTRLKDFFDVHFIVQSEVLDPAILALAIRNTFERRGTALPIDVPRCLTREFAEEKESQWSAFLKRNGFMKTATFPEVVSLIRTKLPYGWDAKESTEG